MVEEENGWGSNTKSKNPYSVDGFRKISTEEMTYPQPKKMGSGYFNFFTKYTGVRQLYFEKSVNGKDGSTDKMLAAIPEKKGEKSGHYQVSAHFNEKKIGTFFNRHPNGKVDQRTDLFYLQTREKGDTWSTVDNQLIEIPCYRHKFTLKGGGLCRTRKKHLSQRHDL